MKIVHFSITPLAGAPLRLTKAINTLLPDHEAHLVDLRRYGSEDFGQDVIFSEEKERAVELANEADIIHLHNYLYYDSRQFEPISFRELKNKGKLFVRQYHSEPKLIARVMGITATELMAQDIPGLVVAQFQERKYPYSMVVPNMVPENDPLYTPSEAGTQFDIFFAPTLTLGAWDARWNTKGMPETEQIIVDVCRKNGAKHTIMHRIPLEQVLTAKRSSRIVVDEMVTGSYHISGLEGLSQGKPVLSYLDDRARWIMAHFAGTCASPFINVRMEDAYTVLDYLLAHPEEAAEIGRNSRIFVENHWSQKILVDHFRDVYQKLVHDPGLICRQPELRVDRRVNRFFAGTLPDLIYKSRKEHFKSDIIQSATPGS
ncbi:MAG: glycosyltransferase family 1 protein [Candidatus Desulfacyla sp.]